MTQMEIEMAKIAEAYCVENGIACNRKFTDEELEGPRLEVRVAAVQAQNIYADAMIRRDKLARHEGRPDHDMTTFGERLRPGR